MVNQQEKQTVENIMPPKAPLWFNLMFVLGSVVLTIGAGFYLGLTVAAILLLLLSASFTGYLTEAYTKSFEIASFAKTIAILMAIAGIVIIFIFEGWLWGIATIVGYWILLAMSVAFWQKNVTYRYK